MMYFILLFSILLIPINGQSDPCHTYDYLHSSEYRGEACPMKTTKPVCDYHIQAGWYRITGDAVILTHQPGLQKCATLYPIWMNGTLPSEDDGIVNRTACRTGLLSHCEEQIPIMVKNCSTFYTYYLNYPSSPSCDSAFCFGPNKECHTEEPCDFYYHEKLPDENHRNLGCDASSTINHCDDTLVSGWYKLSPGLTLTDTCPDHLTCGSDIALWVNGSTPNISDGIVERNVCVSSATNCCKKTYQVKVKNCSEYLSYYLPPSGHCSERYCLGNTNGIECTTLSGTRSSTTTDSNNLFRNVCFGVCKDELPIVIVTAGLIVVFVVTSSILLYTIKIRKRNMLMEEGPSIELSKKY